MQRRQHGARRGLVGALSRRAMHSRDAGAAPATKIAAIERYGGKIVSVSIDEWMHIFRTRHREGMTGVFIHPYSDEAVPASNGVIGLEILEDLPDADAVVVPRRRPLLRDRLGDQGGQSQRKVFACEVDTGAPLAPSLAADSPSKCRLPTTSLTASARRS